VRLNNSSNWNMRLDHAFTHIVEYLPGKGCWIIVDASRAQWASLELNGLRDRSRGHACTSPRPELR
jgi:hypothetical protein